MLSLNIANPFDFSTIYNENYAYSVPKNMLEGFLRGEGFGYEGGYTLEEQKNLASDIQNIWKNIMEKNPSKDGRACLSAGSPGSGKTTKMEQELEDGFGKVFAYIDPDSVCLKQMDQTYQRELCLALEGITDPEDIKIIRKNCYDKWRAASNLATHVILANLIKERYNFYFGTTSSSPHTGTFLDFLKQNEYNIRILYVSATDSVRWESIQERDKSFVQTTEEDIIQKGLEVPKRIHDTFFKYVDLMEFFYRPSAHENATLAGTWDRSKNSFVVSDEEALAGVTAVQDQVAKTLNNSALFWEKQQNLKLKTGLFSSCFIF